MLRAPRAAAARPPHAKGCPALVTAPPHSLTPKECGDKIEKATGVRYSKSHLYALLAALDLSPDPHGNPRQPRLAAERSALAAQGQEEDRHARGNGYTVVAVDEAFLVYNTRKGRKRWPLVGKRVPQLYPGSYKRAAPHCAYAEDGRYLTCFFARANSYTFIEFLKRVTAKFGKVAIVTNQDRRTTPAWSGSSSKRTGGSAPTGHLDGELSRGLPVPQRRRAVLEPAQEGGGRRRALRRVRGPAQGRLKVHGGGPVQPCPGGLPLRQAAPPPPPRHC